MMKISDMTGKPIDKLSGVCTSKEAQGPETIKEALCEVCRKIQDPVTLHRIKRAFEIKKTVVSFKISVIKQDEDNFRVMVRYKELDSKDSTIANYYDITRFK